LSKDERIQLESLKQEFAKLKEKRSIIKQKANEKLSSDSEE